MNEITSRDNQWVKMACSLKQKKGRQAHQRVFVEGLRVIADAAAMNIPDAICFVSERGGAWMDLKPSMPKAWYRRRSSRRGRPPCARPKRSSRMPKTTWENRQNRYLPKPDTKDFKQHPRYAPPSRV